MTRLTTFWLVVLTVLFPMSVAHAAEIQARIDWFNKVELTTPVSGVIESVRVDVGDRVKQGEELLKLEQTPFVTHVKQAKAETAKHQVIRDEAERELERNQEMYDRTMLSLHDLEVTKIALKTAAADLQAAKSKLEQASYELDKSVLRAPFNGMVIRRDAVRGTTVVSRLQTTPLLVLVSTDKYKASATLSEQQFQSLKQRKQVDVTYAGKRYTGNARYSTASGQDGNGRFLIDVVFTIDGDSTAFANETATIYLP